MEDRIPPKFLKLLDYSAILPIDFFHANSAHWFVIPTCEQWTLRHYLIHIIFNDLRNTRRMPYGVYCTCGRSFQILTLSFFSAKLYSSDPTALVCSKRKSGLEVQRRSKRTKPQENRSSLSKRSDDVLSEEIVLGLKRRLRLDDTIPAKKIKQEAHGSGEWQCNWQILMC